jgi:hypothetical protein
LGESLAANSDEVVVAHFGALLAVEASTSGSSDAVFESSVAASRMEDVVHTSAGEPYSGF